MNSFLKPLIRNSEFPSNLEFVANFPLDGADNLFDDIYFY